MKKMTSITLFLFLFSQLSVAKENLFSNMDKDSLKATGLHKLTIEEQKALTKWLNRSDEKIIKKEKRKFMGFQREESEREAISSKIVGDFKGWKGRTLFRLENNQVWKQLGSETFQIRKMNNPVVTIKPKSMGSWTLYVDGYSRGVKVKRVK